MKSLATTMYQANRLPERLSILVKFQTLPKVSSCALLFAWRILINSLTAGHVLLVEGIRNKTSYRMAASQKSSTTLLFRNLMPSNPGAYVLSSHC